MQMPMIAFIGYQGSGKTLSMIREAKKDYDKGMKIYSNINLKGMDYEALNVDWFHGYLIEGNELNNVVVLIDELHIFADARSHKSKVNKILGYFALQTRKRNVKFYFTTQYFDTIDKRIRLCALDDMIIKCDGIYLNGKGEVSYHKGRRVIQQIKQTILYKEQIHKRVITKPYLYFDNYDTEQVLKPLEDG